MAVQYLCCTLWHTLSIATVGPFIAFRFWYQKNRSIKVWFSSAHTHSLVTHQIKNTRRGKRACRGILRHNKRISCSGSIYWSEKDITGEREGAVPAQADGAHGWRLPAAHRLFTWRRPESVINSRLGNVTSSPLLQLEKRESQCAVETLPLLFFFLLFE